MSDETAITGEDIYEALKDVYDPEIPVNVVDLGLIYDLDISGKKNKSRDFF